MNDPIDDMIERLILIGALEVAGIDAKTGEFVYGFTQKLKETNPELFASIQDSIQGNIYELWVEGFLDIDFAKDEPMVTVTEKCFDDQALDELSPVLRAFLDNILPRFRNE